MTTVYDEPTRRMRVIVDPRLKQRWVDARREEGRRRLRIMICAVALAGVFALALGSLYSPLFEVHHIRVIGAGRALPMAEVETVAGVAHVRMLDVHPGAVAARLAAIPVVGTVTVKRKWLATVTVDVTQRTAVAQAPAGNRIAELDATGRVLSYQQVAVPDRPTIDGLDLDGVAPGAWVPGTAGRQAEPGESTAALLAGPTSVDAAAVALAAALPMSLRSRVSAVSVSGGTLDVLLAASGDTPAITVLLGDQSDLAAKLTALVTMVQQADFNAVSEIDLRVPYLPTVSDGPRT